MGVNSEMQVLQGTRTSTNCAKYVCTANVMRPPHLQIQGLGEPVQPQMHPLYTAVAVSIPRDLHSPSLEANPTELHRGVHLSKLNHEASRKWMYSFHHMNVQYCIGTRHSSIVRVHYVSGICMSMAVYIKRTVWRKTQKTGSEETTYIESLLESHDELNGVQRIRPKVTRERRGRHHLYLLHPQLCRHDALHLRENFIGRPPRLQG